MAKKVKHPKEVPSESAGDENATAPDAGGEFNDAIKVLEKVRDAEVLDESLLEELDTKVSALSKEGQRRFAELPVVQKILERAGEDAMGTQEPGTIRRVGSGDMPFAFKVPYSLEAVYKTWPLVDFIADADYTVVTPGGWVFRLHEDIIYDTPLDEKCREGHGYKLPSIVVSIINDSKATLRDNRRETQRDQAFGMGVKFIGDGWAGKDNLGSPGGGEVS